MSGNPLSNENVAERLKLERKAVAGTQTAFCKRIGIEIPRWNNFERGFPLSKSIGILLVQKIPGLTLELFLGKAEGLPLQLRNELESAKPQRTA
jgi:transcriptional regulator with XRE-family HTH domain